jgi:two-component system, OmpR family, sensor histidine kinase KdpD
MGSTGVAAITAFGYVLQLDFAIVGCLFLLLVVFQSAFVAFPACAMVSVVAILSLDFFFVPPIFSLQVERLDYALVLITFLATALVITRLASIARKQARTAEARREYLARLYELASRLVSVRPEIAVPTAFMPFSQLLLDN